MNHPRGTYRGTAAWNHYNSAIPWVPPLPFRCRQPFFGIPQGGRMRVPRPLGLPLGYYAVNSPIRVAGKEKCQRQPSQNVLISSFPTPPPNVLTIEAWNVFNQNGRPHHQSTYSVVCCCTFGEGDALQRVFSVSSGDYCSQHVEKQAIEEVIKLENGCGRGLKKMVLICSSSPCWNCAQDMITFVRSRGFSLNLYFTALQKNINLSKNSINLLASFGVYMFAANDYVWSYMSRLLPKSEGKPSFYDGVKVDDCKAWDKVWSCQLGAVLRQDLRGILSSEKLLSKFNDVQKEMALKPHRTRN